MPRPTRPTPPANPPPSAPISPLQYLTGTWHGQFTDGSGTWDTNFMLRSDGQYVAQQTLAGAQFRLQTMGRYSVQPNGRTFAVELYPTFWQPRQFCRSPESCTPINLPGTVPVTVSPISHDSFTTENGRFQRVGPAQ